MTVRIGQRLQQLFGGDRAPATGDPDAMIEAGVVLLAEGPMLVDRLQDSGVHATGIESVDPVTEVRSYMRIMVRQADLPAARQMLEEAGADGAAGAALDELVDADSVDKDPAAERAAQQTMSGLYLAADRLSSRPADVELVAEVDRLRAVVAESPPPFGVEPLPWKRVASLAVAVVAADETGDEEQVQRAAYALRDFLRDYV